MARKSVADKLSRAMNLVNDRQHTSPGLNGGTGLPSITEKPVVESQETTIPDEIVVVAPVNQEFTEVDGIAIPGSKRSVRKSMTVSIDTRDTLKRGLGIRRGVGKYIGKLLNESILRNYDRKTSRKIVRNSEEGFVDFFRDDPGLSHIVKQATEDRDSKVFIETTQVTVEIDPYVFDSVRMFCQDLRCPQHYVIDYLYKQAVAPKSKPTG